MNLASSWSDFDYYCYYYYYCWNSKV